MAVSLSVEEVQTVLSLIAEERIQRELGHVNNPAHSKAVLKCSGNANRAVPSRSTQWKSAISDVSQKEVVSDQAFKGIVHFEIKIWYLSAYPKGIQDVGVFFSSVDPILMFLGQTVLLCQSYNGRYRSLSI